jgi:hypothetical protein
MARPRVLIAEADVVVNKIADRLHPPPNLALSSQTAPRNVGKPIGLRCKAKDYSHLRPIPPRKRWLIGSRERTVHLMHNNQGGPELFAEQVLP